MRRPLDPAPGFAAGRQPPLCQLRCWSQAEVLGRSVVCGDIRRSCARDICPDTGRRKVQCGLELEAVAPGESDVVPNAAEVERNWDETDRGCDLDIIEPVGFIETAGSTAKGELASSEG